MSQITISILGASIIICALASCKIIASQPSVPVKPIPYFPADISQVNLNINADLTKYIDDADHSAPYQFSGGEDPCQGLRYHYDVTRDPLAFSGAANTIALREKVHFNIRAEYCAKCGHILGMGPLRCLVPKVSGSCGAGDGDPGFDIAYKSSITFLPSYQISTVTTLQSFNTIGSCPITILRINALPILQSKLNGIMLGLGQKVDEKISALNYRSQLEQVWAQLDKEIVIGNLGFLKINPKQLRLSNLDMAAKQLNVTLGMGCLPVINTVSQPFINTPLPDLSVCKLGEGFNIQTDLILDYNTLSASLNGQVQGKEIKLGSKKFIFIKGKIYGGGNSKIVIELAFQGARRGIIYFTGTPVYDDATHKVSVPDLDFDLQTKSLLLRAAAWILNARITSELRNAAQFNLTNTLVNAQAAIETSLTKQLAANVSSTCYIAHVGISGIFPTYDNLIVRPLLKGDMTINVK